MTADTAPIDATSNHEAWSPRVRAAWANVDNGNSAAALAELQAVVADFPDAVDAVHDLGLLQLANGDAAAATTSFERCLALDDGRDDAYYNLGIAFEQQGRPADAVDAYGKHHVDGVVRPRVLFISDRDVRILGIWCAHQPLVSIFADMAFE